MSPGHLRLWGVLTVAGLLSLPVAAAPPLAYRWATQG
ncbi:hypothetical protein PF70_04961, partial [Pseudomonas asplenii]